MVDPTLKVDPLTLELLDHRMRNSKLPSKPSQNLLNISDSFDTGKIIPEAPKSLYVSLLSSQDIPPNNNIQIEEHLSPSDKENSKGFISIEPGSKLTGPQTTDIKTDNTTDLSYQSSIHRDKGSRSLKKRKYEKFEKPADQTNIETKPEQNFELATKKAKLTLPQAPTGNGTIIVIPENFAKGTGGVDSNGSDNNDYKEVPMTSLGSKKITDYYLKSTAAPMTTEKPVEKEKVKPAGNKGKVKGAVVEKKPAEVVAEVKESGENNKELYTRIRDLEDRLEASKKDREKDQIKASNELQNYQDQFEKYKCKVHKILARHELDLENYKRNERKSLLNRQKQRLGEYVSQREGSKFTDVWCDGSEIRSVKEKLETIMKEREELEKQKKNIKSKKVSGSVASKAATENHLSLPTSIISYTTNENSDSNSSMDLKETKERIAAKINMLQREENLLREELERLEVEKTIFYQQYKKQYEEDHSRYGRPNSETNAPAWPILSERYQLLSLLGKGGFSEVYKAYDLEELAPVACKVHQLNPNWTENAKTNYVKHANREFEVHKELNHPNIVRLFDCINIDDHSFATVLEYCEGPDLSFYLKQHKSLPEKDAKTIIKQILAGLKYLSDHKTKIIHYDLKPQNVMFHKGEVKISDFGLCKIVDSDASRIELTSQGVGTYWYLPPECFIMEDQPPMINNKVDVWSVGIIYFEMLFGMKPFGNNMSQEKILKEQVILKSYNVNFPSKPQISNETKDFIKKCLAYNQDDRIDIYEAYDIMYNGKK